MALLLRHISLPLATLTLAVEAELPGGITILFGPSGAGKTTLLEVIAGLRPASQAFIQLGEEVLTDTARGVAVPARWRGIGYVPQDLALFPHLSVRHNLNYGRKTGDAAKPLFSLEHVVRVLDIAPLLSRGVAELSGGEQHRVALARALLASPRLLLLDEPLAGLDAGLKARIIPYLARIREEFQLPMVYVTHDRHEMLALGDTLAVLVDGRVAQCGPLREVFHRPANLAVAGLVAVETVQPGRILNIAGGLASVAVGTAELAALAEGLPAGTETVYVCIRAEDVILLKEGNVPSSARNRLAAVVQSSSPAGPLTRVELDCGFPLTVLLTRQACTELSLTPGARITALVKAPSIHLIPR